MGLGRSERLGKENFKSKTYKLQNRQGRVTEVLMEEDIHSVLNQHDEKAATPTGKNNGPRRWKSGLREEKALMLRSVDKLFKTPGDRWTAGQREGWWEV